MKGRCSLLKLWSRSELTATTVGGMTQETIALCCSGDLGDLASVIDVGGSRDTKRLLVGSVISPSTEETDVDQGVSGLRRRDWNS